MKLKLILVAALTAVFASAATSLAETSIPATTETKASDGKQVVTAKNDAGTTFEKKKKKKKKKHNHHSAEGQNPGY